MIYTIYLDLGFVEAPSLGWIVVLMTDRFGITLRNWLSVVDSFQCLKKCKGATKFRSVFPNGFQYALMQRKFAKFCSIFSVVLNFMLIFRSTTKYRRVFLNFFDGE